MDSGSGDGIRGWFIVKVDRNSKLRILRYVAS
jgi:hypothetical protein